MGKEKKLIEMMHAMMPRTEHQKNKLFETDSEVIEYGGGRWLFTMDEFSQEDLLREHDPYALGWNIAVGAVSDILATGGQPLFYAHSMTVSEAWSESYIQQLSKGVADVLKACGAAFIGGDFGRSTLWRYTAAVIGSVQDNVLRRSGAAPGDAIYLTGEVGKGNMESVLKLYSEKKVAGTFARKIKNLFPLRIREAELVRKYAWACIDTSDGVFNAANTLAEMSGKGYQLENLPYVKQGLLAAKVLRMPKTLLFLGEGGEYELLFTVDREKEEALLEEAKTQGLVFYKIGTITDEPGRVLYEDGRRIQLEHLNVRARDYQDVKTYIKELIHFLGMTGQ